MVSANVPQGRGATDTTTTTVARLVAVALVIVLAGADKARAGIVIGPGGHVPFAGSSEWQAVGEAVSVSGSTGWSYTGTTTDVQVLEVQDGYTTLTLNNIVGTQFGGGASQPATLSSAAAITAQNLGAGRVSARGWSSAIINDIVLVQPVGGSFNFGAIDFRWRIDGVLQYDMTSTNGDWLNLPRGFKWAHYAHAQTYITLRPPGTNNIQTDDKPIGTVSMTKAGTNLTSAQESAFEFLRHDDPDPQTVSAAAEFGSGVTSFQQRQELSQSGSYNHLIAGPWGSPIEVMLGLATFYNSVWDLTDFGGLDAGVYAQFESTATLEAVHLYNADGSPYTGQWTLVSQNGIDYPEGVPVPEPGTSALVASGLLGLAWRLRARDRRRAGRSI